MLDGDKQADDEKLTVATSARLAEVSEATIRNWERRGILPAERTASGLGIFTRADVLRVAAARRIK